MTAKRFWILMVLICISFFVVQLLWVELIFPQDKPDKAIQEQVIQTEAQGINREIQYLQSVQSALDERIIALKIGLRDLSAKLQALKTVEIDTTKTPTMPSPPKEMKK